MARGGAREGAGRKAKSEKGRVVFSVSCTEEQREKIKKLAVEKNMAVSELILKSLGIE